MFPRQDRDTRRLFSIRHLWDRHHRQRGEDAVAVAHFQGHGVEQPLPDRIAAQRPREVRRIGSGPTSGDRFGATRAVASGLPACREPPEAVAQPVLLFVPLGANNSLEKPHFESAQQIAPVAQEERRQVGANQQGDGFSAFFSKLIQLVPQTFARTLGSGHD